MKAMYAWLFVGLFLVVMKPINAASFTYHGTLQDEGKAADGNYDLQLFLYSTKTGNMTLANPVTVYNVPVKNGRFSTTVNLDTPEQLAGTAWLEVKVRSSGQTDFAALAGRSSVSPDAGTCPASWNLDGNAAVPPGSYVGTADATELDLAINGQRVAAYIPAAGDGTPNIVAGSVGNQIDPSNQGSVIAGGGAQNFANVLQGDFSVVGGGEGNSILNGHDVVVAGGWSNVASGYNLVVSGGESNDVSGEASTVSGGSGNSAGGQYATIGGGQGNTIGEQSLHGVIAGGGSNQLSGDDSVIGGGSDNSIDPGDHDVIAGGYFNQASGTFNTIGGGSHNIVSGFWATVSGGNQNEAGYQATVSGGDTNVANAPASAIGGGESNTIANAAGDAVIAGGLLNQANGWMNSIGGGSQNLTDGEAATIAGGENNNAFDFGSIGGGKFNSAGSVSSIGGGEYNHATADHGTIGGGRNNEAGQFGSVGGGENNQASGTFAVIAGGEQNAAYGNNAFVGGGQSNLANDLFAIVVGGDNNAAGDHGFIGAGSFNQAASGGAVISGNSNQALGTASFVGNGWQNQATGYVSVILNGENNVASGIRSVVLGGFNNKAGADDTLAAGTNARVRDPNESGTPSGDTGTFLWNCASCSETLSTGPDQFLVMANGGMAVNTNDPQGFTFAVNGTAANATGAWSVYSDARLKENIQPLEHALERFLDLRAYTFEYTDSKQALAEDGEHVGFVAQQVETVFPEWVDEDSRGYKYVTAKGFDALTVEALRELREEKDAEIGALRKQNSELSDRLDRLSRQLDEFERRLAH